VPTERLIYPEAVSESLNALTERMRAHGASDPEGWARSELSEDIPQEARFLFLRSLWADTINGLTPQAALKLPAAQRLVAAGASIDDVVTVMRAAAYEAAFGVVMRLDEGEDSSAPDDSPGWTLMETRGDTLTGRLMDALHEDLLMLDPGGREGGDLWE